MNGFITILQLYTVLHEFINNTLHIRMQRRHGMDIASWHRGDLLLMLNGAR